VVRVVRAAHASPQHDARRSDRDDDGTMYNPFADLLKNSKDTKVRK